LQSEAPMEPGIAAPDSHGSARLDEWFVFEGKPRLNLDMGLPVSTLALVGPSASTHGLAQPIPCNHDPPPAQNLRSRAPPV